MRRGELLDLKIDDIDTENGKYRIRINQGKGSKDRFTVLSKIVLKELREYFLEHRPIHYLFHGRHKGHPMTAGAFAHALKEAVKRTGIRKNVNMHLFRHSFASHALEEGINIKTLQHIMGHASIQTTMVYLHVSDISLSKAFSPLDAWEKKK